MYIIRMDPFDVGNCNFCHQTRLFVWYLKSIRGINDAIICDGCLDKLIAFTRPITKDCAVQNNDAADNK